jgi:hypothetical protein
MKRILITGNAGAGKTTFSKRLAKETGLPHYSLDSIVWKSGWVKAKEEERREGVQNLVARDAWIIDGVSGVAMNAADAIIFIDIPLYRCLFNILKRFLSNGFGTRECLPENCPEYIGVFKALQVALKYQKNTRPWIIDSINFRQGKNIIWCKSYAELANYRRGLFSRAALDA